VRTCPACFSEVKAEDTSVVGWEILECGSGHRLRWRGLRTGSIFAVDPDCPLVELSDLDAHQREVFAVGQARFREAFGDDSAFRLESHWNDPPEEIRWASIVIRSDRGVANRIVQIEPGVEPEVWAEKVVSIARAMAKPA
jgi:hypothetical protein